MEVTAQEGGPPALVAETPLEELMDSGEEPIEDPPTPIQEEPLAAVVFDPTSRSFSVLDADEIDGAGVGECITVANRLITIMSLCPSLASAKEEARIQAANMSSVMKTEVRQFNVNGNGLEESGSDNTEGDDIVKPDEDEEDDIDCLSVADETRFDEGVVGESRYRLEDESAPIDYENQDAIRTLMEIMFQELNEDILRINQRQNRMRNLIDAYLGGRAAPGVIADIRRPPHRLLRPIDDSTESSRGNRKRRSDRHNEWIPKRPHHQLSDDDEDWENDGDDSSKSGDRAIARGAPTLKKYSSQARPHYPALANYPFLVQEEELECIAKANGSASEYARRLGKLLFVESLHLYFKDQDVKKRQWLHYAVDARFPSEDRQAQATKWKNCSGAINKNRICEDLTPQPSRYIDYLYVAKEDEEFAFGNCHQDPTKYAELLGMKLFEGTLDRMFRDQDAVKKEWLRECVDIRFPCHDKVKRDGRWKVCASAVNRNRNKAVDISGSAIAYPYISQEIEERCFAVAKDNVALYAELLGRLLFKNTRHLMFKDQDPKIRQWVHDIIDRRYPTPDKTRHSAKWKTCSSAINKARFTADYPMPWEHGKAVPGHLGTPLATTTVAPWGVSIPVPTSAPATVNQGPSSTVAPARVTPTTRSTRRSIAIAARDAAKEQQDKHVNGRVVRDEPYHSKRVVIKRPKLERTGLPYPFITEDEEINLYENADGNVQTFARTLARVLFRESLELYFKDQDPKKRDWLRMIVDHRFPSADKLENLQKWKSCSGAINKNRIEKR